MKKNFYLNKLAGMLCMSAVLCFAVSCDRAGKDEGGGDEPTELTPSVKIATGESGEDFLTFTLIPENAAEVRYMVLPASDPAPDAAGIMNEGKSADPVSEKEYTAAELIPSTGYVIFAAARNSEGLTSMVAKADMTTREHVPIVPEVTISEIKVDGNSAFVTYSLKDADAAFCVCLPSSEPAPSADILSADGSNLPLDVSEPLSIKNLEYEASYVFYAVAVSADKEYSDVASCAFETGKPPVTPPAVGDYYYSDGTWSSGSESPLDGKTVVGVVFKSGAADSDLSDYNAAGIDEIHGFAVALSDVKDNSDPFSPKTGFEWSDSPLGVTSADQDDFSGYYNTVKIMEAIGNIGGSSDVVSYIVDFYDSQVPAPESSTGWYLPSLGQLKELYNVRSEVYAAFDMVDGDSLYDFSGDWYWSSTESGEDGTVYKVNFLDSGLVVESDDIARLWKVRPVLAF